MNFEFSDADFSEVERQLRERHLSHADDLRSKVLGAVVAELEREHNARGSGSAWPYVAMAACLLLGLGLARAAGITPLIPAGVSQREEAVVSVPTLRRLCPELSEDDARQLAPFISFPRTAVALPLPQADSSPVRGDVDTPIVIRRDSI